MQPKTKIQKRVVEMSASLPQITSKQEKWAFEHCIEKYAVRSRNTLFCLFCGHSWKDTAVLVSIIVGATCPCCKNKLKITQNYNKECKDMSYMAILCKKEEFQVVRMLLVRSYMRKLQKPIYHIDEVMQHWIDVKGNVTTLSKQVRGFTHCYDEWI